MAFGRLQKALAIALVFLACYAVAESVKGQAIGKALHELTASEIEDQLQVSKSQCYEILTDTFRNSL